MIANFFHFPMDDHHFGYKQNFLKDSNTDKGPNKDYRGDALNGLIYGNLKVCFQVLII
jgi:hypothetical protein